MTTRDLPDHIQRFDLGPAVTLYLLDLTEFGLGLIRLAPYTDDQEEPATSISFGSETFAPHPVTADGFELSTGGSLPRPRFAVGNLDNSFTALVEQNDDLSGALLYRIRTYGRYLDSGEEPDGLKHAPLDVFLLSLKTKHNEETIEWQCAALMDQEGVQLPGRVMVRDYCDHEYRRWTGSGFDYENVTCPYAGTDYFDENGDPTTAPFDKPSKRLGTCCMVRFGATAVLPTRAFPGMASLATR